MAMEDYMPSCVPYIESGDNDLYADVKELCDLIINSPPNTTIKGRIEELAFMIAHYDEILNTWRKHDL